VSAEIVQFVPRPRDDRRLPRDTAHLFRFPIRQVDDLTMDHADTAPCEYVPPFEPWHKDEPA
jgi:hypothetical protein